MLALDIRDLKKSYLNHDILRGLNLQVEEGAFYGLLGRNGAGKTTTLGIITGLIHKNAGMVKIFDYDIDKNPLQARRHIGFVSQDFNFNQFETLEQVVINQAGFYGVKRAEARRRANELLELMALKPYCSCQTHELSGGTKKRMMLIRALLHRPRILILDEPTAGVDIEVRHLMWDLIRHLNEQGTTVLLTTHYFEEIENLCSRVAILDGGVIIDEGSVVQLTSQLNHKTVILTIGEAIPKDCPLTLRSLEDHVVEYSYDSSNTTLTDVLSLFKNYGMNVISLRSKTSALEEYFLQQGSRKQ